MTVCMPPLGKEEGKEEEKVVLVVDVEVDAEEVLRTGQLLVTFATKEITSHVNVVYCFHRSDPLVLRR